MDHVLQPLKPMVDRAAYGKTILRGSRWSETCRDIPPARVGKPRFSSIVTRTGSKSTIVATTISDCGAKTDDNAGVVWPVLLTSAISRLYVWWLGMTLEHGALSDHGDAGLGARASEVVFSARGELIAAAVAGVLLIVGLVVLWAGTPLAAQWVWGGALAAGLLHGGRAAWEALRERSLDIDVLMVVAAGLAALIGAIWEGALLLFLFVLSSGLEGLAAERTQRAVRALHTLMPTKALRQEGSDWVSVAPESLVGGDVVKVLPGESIPADARVEEGRTSVDQSSLTGESLPRGVGVGDEVYAGTINVGDPVRCRVTRPAKESSLQRVLNLVMEAQQQREPVQRVIDRLSQPYAIVVMVLSVTVFLVWWLGFGDEVTSALYVAITLLIVASPCAVIIATPTATLAAIARGARAGVLFKGGQSLERLSRLGAVAFDKTGTLTVGKMRVREVHAVGWSDERRLLATASGLEQDSTHPIAAAIRAAGEATGLEPAKVDRPGFTAGRGVSGEIDAVPARLGTFVFVEPLIPTCLRSRVREVLGKVQQRGQIGTVVAWNDMAGVVILSDSVRPGADELVDRLHTMGVRPVIMLTGDNRATAKSVADSLGLDAFHAELLPEDKLNAIRTMREQLRARSPRLGVGVIGDGVNDAPALAAADVSIAIGSIGSDAALESADIVLMADDLRTVPWAVRLARRARWTILANLAFALGAIALMCIALLVSSRVGVRVPMWMGVLGHEGGTLLVVVNSLLILGMRAPEVVRPRALPGENPEHREIDQEISTSST